MGKRSSFERRERDFYPTPREAILPLIPHLEYGTSFVEPCAGDMALVNALESEGMSCLWAMDIAPRHPDVIQIDALSGDIDLWCDSADYIITNPPWSRPILHAMINSFARIRPTWLLFDADWMHTTQEIMARKHGVRTVPDLMQHCRKIVSVGRVKWFPDSPFTGKDNVAWYLFDVSKSGSTIFVGR